MFCESYRIIKRGVRGGVTRYFCKGCQRSFSSRRREKKKIKKLFKLYVFNKQTKDQLEKSENICRNTITRILDDYEAPVKVHQPRPLVVVVDATYFGRGHGVLVARDPNQKENLHAHEIVSETKAEYQKVKVDLEALGYQFQAVVLDGRTGIPRVFDDLPVQICHFHQWQIIRRKLTLKPKLPAHQALFSIGRKIGSTTEAGLEKLLNIFLKHFKKDLEEKTYVWGTNRWHYTHTKLRSAYGSLRRNLFNLYTYQKYPQLKIPNTTNSLDGSFNALKSHVNVHRGLRADRRLKIIREYLKL